MLSGSRREFLQTMAAGCLGAAGLRPMQAASRLNQPISMGSRRQLLFDDFLVAMGGPKLEDYPFNVRWSPGKVEKSTTSSLLHADQPWENTTAWLCVLHDAGRYRLWYNAASATESGLFVSSAESDDGLNWRKPTLNLIERNGSKRNNIVYTGGPDGWEGELGKVFIDPTAKPGER